MRGLFLLFLFFVAFVDSQMITSTNKQDGCKEVFVLAII